MSCLIVAGGRAARGVRDELLRIELDHVHIRLHPLRLGRSLGRAGGGRRQRAEQAVRLAEGAGGEVHRVGVAAAAAVADLERPQPVDLDRLAVGVLELAQRRSGGGVEGVDAARCRSCPPATPGRWRALRPAKPDGAIANPHGESSGPRETRRTASAGQARGAVQVEDVDEAAVRAGHVVVLGGVLPGVGDVDLAVQDLDVERGVAGGQLRVGERARPAAP